MTAADYDTFIESIEAGHTIKQSIKAAKTSWRAIQMYIASTEEAARRYARARVSSADFYADRAQDAVEHALTSEDATVAKVKADVYRWRAKVANPLGYGDRQSTDVTITVGQLHLDALRASTMVQVAQTLALPTVTAIATPSTVDAELIDG